MLILIIAFLLNLSIVSHHQSDDDEDDWDLSNAPLSMSTSAKRRESSCECRPAVCKHNRYHRCLDCGGDGRDGDKEEEVRIHLQY